jgi:hypothetical protein
MLDESLLTAYTAPDLSPYSVNSKRPFNFLLQNYVRFSFPARYLDLKKISLTILEAWVVTEAWRKHYNTIRLHSSSRYRAPAPESYILHQVANA